MLLDNLIFADASPILVPCIGLFCIALFFIAVHSIIQLDHNAYLQSHDGH